MATTLAEMPDEQLDALHQTLVVDARHDREARERLELVEEERARRVVASAERRRGW
jgi:hypothetical protein